MRTDKEPKAPAEMKEKVFLIEYQDRNLNTNSFYADNFEIGPAIEDVIEELKEDEAFEIKITPRYLTAKQIEEIKQASE